VAGKKPVTRDRAADLHAMAAGLGALIWACIEQLAGARQYEAAPAASSIP